MNLGTYTSIVLFGSMYHHLEHSRLCRIIHERSFFGSLFSPMSLIPRRSSSTSRFFRKTPSILLLMTGRNQEITPYVQNYRRSPLRSNNSIELSMTVCVIVSTILGMSMNPILAIAQDTLF
ncbi:hypothetical protein MUK42_35466 [Musa troglodytarum]|uniref:NADH-plastoquinone oxidoreductase subunit 2 n=1 Tax=Musa troglodytarum TaxID=320322 RepID=A0A9E7KIL7_9LILI|nr:hypothetical protein MUK42_35466 [Musa troglodytarum]